MLAKKTTGAASSLCLLSPTKVPTLEIFTISYALLEMEGAKNAPLRSPITH